jgi:phosphogluconate dehydratase
VLTVVGHSLRAHCTEPLLIDAVLSWHPVTEISADKEVLRGVESPFSVDGGLRLMQGNLGRAIMKVSAVRAEHRVVKAPAIVFESQQAFNQAYQAGLLDRDFVAVLRFQGPRANGMPELHALTPALGILQDAGRRVALVTDGRMSGASGKVPSAIHVSPEILAGGPLGLVRDGDMILVDGEAGTLDALVDPAEWALRRIEPADLAANDVGMGRELFAMFRHTVSAAEEGATTFGLPPILQQTDDELSTAVPPTTFKEIHP